MQNVLIWKIHWEGFEIFGVKTPEGASPRDGDRIRAANPRGIHVIPIKIVAGLVN